MPRIDIGGGIILLALLAWIVGYFVACREDKRQAREREEMRRHVGREGE